MGGAACGVLDAVRHNNSHSNAMLKAAQGKDNQLGLRYCRNDGVVSS